MRTRRRINPTTVGRRPFLLGLAATVATAPLAMKATGRNPLRILERGTPVDVTMTSAPLSQSTSVVVEDAAIAARDLVDSLHPNRGLVREFRRDTQFSQFALTWRGDADVTAFFRAERADGTWSEWYAADAHNLSSGSDMGSGRNGTELIYLEPTTAVQVSTHGLDLMPDVDAIARGDIQGAAESVGLRTLDDVQAVFIDGNSSGSAIVPITETTDTTGMPHVITRAGWGADESMRTRTAGHDPVLQAATVHHTAGSNNYSQAEAAGIVRGIFKYHAETLGWGDIGYNALVDKFGNIYEGRFGGLDNNVQGAHAGGFNKGTWGISMMGDYSTAQPTPAMINAIGTMIGWRLHRAEVDPKATTSLTSQGFRTAKYARGQSVELPTVFAHRDTGNTTCPGEAGYAQMDRIRDIAHAKYTALNNGDVGNEGPVGGSDIRADLPGIIAGLPIVLPFDESQPAPEGADTANPDTANPDTTNPDAEVLADGGPAATGTAEPFSGGRSILAASLGLAGAPGLGASAAEVLGAVGREPDQGPSLADVPVQVPPSTTIDGDDEFAAEWRAVKDAYGNVLGQPVTGVQQGATVPNETGEADPVRYVKFEHGIIVTSVATGTHAIWEEVAEAWANQGFEIGPLGAPTTTQAPNWGADRADFQGGHITRDGVTRQVNVVHA